MGAPTLVVGEALVDIVHEHDGTLRAHPGGSPLNVAIGLARLGHQVEFATFIGEDDNGRSIQAHLAHDHVELSPGSFAATRTATSDATLDETGAASYVFDIDWQLPYQLPSVPGHFHTGSIAAVLPPGGPQVREATLAARDHGTVSYDPNARPTLIGDPANVRREVELFVGLSDVVKSSDEDILWLYDDAATIEDLARLWAGLGPSLVVITRGGAGAIAYFPDAPEDDRLRSFSGRTVDLVDTVGAGDSFMSGLLSGLLDADLLGEVSARQRLREAGWEQVAPAIDRAIATSAITVSREGAQPPTRAEIT